MAYTITKLADGDLSLGNLRGELVNLQPASSDYPTGGYLIQGIGGATESTGNVGMDKVLAVLPVGGQQGYEPVWQPATSKLEMLYNGSSAPGSNVQVPASTDLSALTFELLLLGY
jgi:hypothetical protein